MGKNGAPKFEVPCHSFVITCTSLRESVLHEQKERFNVKNTRHTRPDFPYRWQCAHRALLHEQKERFNVKNTRHTSRFPWSLGPLKEATKIDFDSIQKNLSFRFKSALQTEEIWTGAIIALCMLIYTYVLFGVLCATIHDTRFGLNHTSKYLVMNSGLPGHCDTGIHVPRVLYHSLTEVPKVLGKGIGILQNLQKLRVRVWKCYSIHSQ